MSVLEPVAYGRQSPTWLNRFFNANTYYYNTYINGRGFCRLIGLLERIELIYMTYFISHIILLQPRDFCPLTYICAVDALKTIIYTYCITMYILRATYYFLYNYNLLIHSTWKLPQLNEAAWYRSIIIIIVVS